MISMSVLRFNGGISKDYFGLFQFWLVGYENVVLIKVIAVITLKNNNQSLHRKTIWPTTLIIMSGQKSINCDECLHWTFWVIILPFTFVFSF